ncbi:unnamed protein product [Oppiella nova]|uniref:Glutathione S-transferase kappa n=1 Tax=Oppiella nova TaxID=334625 RepID=A0A7R9M410_9ACAR|nr:unnamed protein product [Oppiella nova]CAG2170281.1 unnamed protein product [Oppiella nova]
MSSKRIVVDLFYDIISPYSWISFEVLCRYRPEWQSMSLRLRPFLLGGVLKQSGNTAPIDVPNKMRYMPTDIQRLGQLYGVPIDVPMDFPEVVLKKSLKAQRFITAIDLLTKGKSTEDISRQLWRRVFVSHQDVTLPDSLREAAKCCPISEDIVEKAIVSLDQNQIKDKLRKNTEEALSYGAFGAPTHVLHLPNGPQMVFGSDRIDIIGALLGEKYMGPLLKKRLNN